MPNCGAACPRGSGGSASWRAAADEPSAARVAGLFCASTDLGGLPYALSPAPVPPLSGLPGMFRPTVVAGPQGPAVEPGGDGGPAVPFYGSTALLAALVRPPEAEVPGVRFALRPDFDVTPEAPPVTAGHAAAASSSARSSTGT